MGGLCAILNQHTILVFWNKSVLTFRKPALQKIKKFLYTFLNFLSFMKHISKNNLIIFLLCFLTGNFRLYLPPYCSSAFFP